MIFPRTTAAALGMLPPVAAITIAEINASLGCASLVIGIAFTLWNWRRIARNTRPE